MMAGRGAKNKTYKQVFLESYCVDFPWAVRSQKGDNFAKCIVCKCDVNIAHSGRRDLKLHGSSVKHQNNEAAEAQAKSNKIKNFFSVQNNDFSAIRAECYFTAFIVEHNLPVAVADHAGHLFRKMFPQCEDAKRYGCGRTKTTAIIGEMAKQHKTSVTDFLKTIPFSVATDGSNDDSKLYPIVVTYYSTELSIVNCVLLSVKSLQGAATGKNIGEMIVATLTEGKIPLENCIALGSDNAAVMTGSKNGVAAILKLHQENVIVLGCACHLLHLAAEKGSKGLQMNVDEILVDIYYYLDKSSKRKDRLKEFQKLCDTDVKKVLKHVCTRWLSLGVCLKRLVDLWEPLVKFYKEEIDTKLLPSTSSSLSMYKIPKKPEKQTEKVEATSSCETTTSSPSVVNSGRNMKITSHTSKIPCTHEEPVSKKAKTTSGSKTGEISQVGLLSRQERVFMFLTDNVNKALCYFLLHVIPIFDEVNVALQSKAPQIHKLRNMLSQLLKDLLIKFVKASAIKSTPVRDVKYNSLVNQKNDEDIVIGTSAVQLVTSLKPSQKVLFYNSVRKFFQLSCDYIVLKFPLENEILIHAEVADIKNIESASFTHVKFFVEKFPCMLVVKAGETVEEAKDVLQGQFCALQVETDLPTNSSERMDVQWSTIGKIEGLYGCPKFDRLAFTMLSILVIPHSNAECERVFSGVKKTRTTFRASMSDDVLNNILLAKYQSAQKKCYEQDFNVDFLKTAKSAVHLSLQKHQHACEDNF